MPVKKPSCRNKILTYLWFASKQDRTAPYLGPSMGPSCASISFPRFPLLRSLEAGVPQTARPVPVTLHRVGAGLHADHRQDAGNHPCNELAQSRPVCCARMRERTLPPDLLQKISEQFHAYYAYCHHAIRLLSRRKKSKQIRDRQPTSHPWHASRSSARVARLRLLSLLKQLHFPHAWRCLCRTHNVSTHISTLVRIESLTVEGTYCLISVCAVRPSSTRRWRRPRRRRLRGRAHEAPSLQPAEPRTHPEM